MEKKQTAIEWIETEISKLNRDIVNIKMVYEDYHKKRISLWVKAKEMEKEQIIDAHNKGIWPESKVFDDGEEYYNKTYIK